MPELPPIGRCRGEGWEEASRAVSGAGPSARVFRPTVCVAFVRLPARLCRPAPVGAPARASVRRPRLGGSDPMEQRLARDRRLAMELLVLALEGDSEQAWSMRVQRAMQSRWSDLQLWAVELSARRAERLEDIDLVDLNQA